MTASRPNIGHLKAAVGVLVLGLAACDSDRTSRLGLPTAPTIGVAPPVPPSPAPAPSPSPGIRFGPLEYTPIEIGAVVRGPLVMPPECYDLAGWPCRYFQVTPPTSGRLRVVLAYSSAMQGGQLVDLMVRRVEPPTVEVDAQFKNAIEARVEAPVVAGQVYSIILWYAFDGLEFELTTSVE